MNANTSRHSPAQWDEGIQLLSRTTRDLPAGRHQFHKERLMAQIGQAQHNQLAAPAKTRRFRLPRPAIVLPALAVGLAAVVVATVVLPGEEQSGLLATGPALTTEVGAPSTQSLPQLLDRISLSAAKAPHPVVEPGQYIYIESKQARSFVKTVDDESMLVGQALHRRQSWMSPDGTKGWLIDPSVNDSPEGETLSLPDEKGDTPVAGLNGPSYDYLAQLTTDPDELLAKIYKETKGMGTSPDQQAFATIGDLLGEGYPPAELYPVLFKTAAKIPGVVVVDDAVDAVGRHGVAVARLDEVSGQREEWIFDEETHVYLGERSVQVKKVGADGALIIPGTIVYTNAIVTRAIVDGIKQTPSRAS